MLAQTIYTVKASPSGDAHRVAITHPDGKLGRELSETHTDATDAADFAAWMAATTPNAVARLPRHLRDSLITRWELEGLHFAATGQRIDACWNSHQRRAYRTAEAARLTFGWVEERQEITP